MLGPTLLYAEGQDFVAGATKIFIRDPQTVYSLERCRQSVLPLVVLPIQAAARVWLQRRGAAKRLQALARGAAQRRRFAELRRRCRGVPPRVHATNLQRAYRGYLARRALDGEVYAVCAAIVARMRRRRAASVALTSMARVRLSQVRRRSALESEEGRLVERLRGGVLVQRYLKGSLFLRAGKVADVELRLVGGADGAPLRICWSPNSGLSSRGRAGVPLSVIESVERGAVTARAFAHTKEDGVARRCFSLVPFVTDGAAEMAFKAGDSMDFIAGTEDDAMRLSRVFVRLIARENPSVRGSFLHDGLRELITN